MFTFINRVAIIICNIEEFANYHLVSPESSDESYYVLAFSTLRVYIQPGLTIDSIGKNMNRILSIARNQGWEEEKVAKLEHALDFATPASFQNGTRAQ